MAAPRDTAITLSGPAGRVEGILTEPTGGAPVAIAVVCHPHPLHDGTMHNKVAHTLARAFVARRVAALRFNFRGVGASEGTHDEGHGETDDALAVAAVMRERFGDPPLWFAGFSFGAHVALRAATQVACAGLVLVAPPVRRFDADQALPACPVWVVTGDADDLVSADDVLAWVNAIEPGPGLVVMPGVGHFFHGHLIELRDTVAGFVGDA